MVEEVNRIDSSSVHELHGFDPFVFHFLSPNDYNDKLPAWYDLEGFLRAMFW